MPNENKVYVKRDDSASSHWMYQYRAARSLFNKQVLPLKRYDEPVGCDRYQIISRHGRDEDVDYSRGGYDLKAIRNLRG